MPTKLSTLPRWIRLACLMALPLVLLALSPLPAHAADPVDPAHAGGASEPTILPGPEKALIPAVTTLIVFSVLLAVLGKYAFGPISSGLKAREDKIRRDIEAAEAARVRAEASQREYAAQMETAEQRVRDLLAQASVDGQQVATRIRMQAQEEAEEIKERAMRDIESSRREAIEQIRREAGELATAIAEKILRREINRDDQHRLVEESLSEFAGSR